ncbi:hypothetical protein PV350_36910 [Streptomyces sp. PA03-6a]|nr:hypothetical protein [Streptomyces sp. PA03-6a]
MDVPVLFGRSLPAPPVPTGAAGRPEDPSPPGTLLRPPTLPFRSGLSSRSGHEPGRAADGPLSFFP